MTDCSCAGRNLDRFLQPAILSILGTEPLHGYSIMERLRAMPMFVGHDPDSTGMYRYLNGMESRGLLTSTWDMSASGPAKKVFQLTDLGRDCLRRWVETLDDYHGQLGQLLGVLRQSARHEPRARTCACKAKASPPPAGAARKK